MPVNDTDPSFRGATPSSPDPHGRAALLLVESLIHGLCENSTLSNVQAIEIIERAVDVQFDEAEEADGVETPLYHSHRLLTAILASLKLDGDGDGDGSSPSRLRLV